MTKVLTSKIEALTTYANGITGKNDTSTNEHELWFILLEKLD